MKTPLDPGRVEELTMEILKLIKINFEVGPAPDRMRVYEALNALGIAAGTIIGGTEDPEALDFFSTAMFNQMQEVSIDHARKRRQN